MCTHSIDAIVPGSPELSPVYKMIVETLPRGEKTGPIPRCFLLSGCGLWEESGP